MLTRRQDLPGHRVVTGVTKNVRFESAESIQFKGATLEGVDLRGLSFGTFSAGASEFRDCDFRGARFIRDGRFGSVGKQSRYIGCRFDGADLRAMWSLGNVRFERCSFDDAKIHDWWGDAAEFIDCHFAGRLTMCRFEGRVWNPGWLEPGRLDPPRDRNEFHGNDFRAAELIDCGFRHGIDINANLWPDGPEYIRLDRFPERIDRARAIIEAWADDAARKEGLSILAIYSRHGYEEQREFFTRRDNMGTSPEVAETWRILGEPI